MSNSNPEAGRLVGLSGRVALVTGSTRGIGWATAELLATCGATVVLNGRTDSDLLRARHAELLTATDAPHQMAAFDVADSVAVSDAYRRVAKTHGRLDILVNNAGILGDAAIGMIPDAVITDTLATNVRGCLNNLQAASRLMSRQRSGSVINVASIIGLRGNPGQSVYAASKAAIVGLTRAAAKELAPRGIRVNALAPGYIDTDMIRHLEQERHEALLRTIPFGRIGTPGDVARAVLFLASELSSYVTGQVLGVDGCMVL